MAILAYENDLLLLIERLNEQRRLNTIPNKMFNVYEKLRKRRIQMPDIEPVAIGHAKFDKTWAPFHSTFLQDLINRVKDNEFGLDQWNFDVKFENGKRRSQREQIISEPGFTAIGHAKPIRLLLEVSQATGSTTPPPSSFYIRIKNWFKGISKTRKIL